MLNGTGATLVAAPLLLKTFFDSEPFNGHRKAKRKRTGEKLRILMFFFAPPFPHSTIGALPIILCVRNFSGGDERG